MFCLETPARAVTLVIWCLPLAALAADSDRPADREQIGTVFGKPVYRDQIRTGKPYQLRDELHRLFADAGNKKYREAHRPDIEPTAAEIEAATRIFDEDHRKRLAGQVDKLRAELADLDGQLTATNLPPEQRQTLERRKSGLELQLKPPGRQFALFMLSNWKFQKHLYDEYGGGRILWQQAGIEAFDAQRKWLEAREKSGEFTITDAQLRSVFYEYWTTQNHGAFLTADPQRIRDEFLEPAWVAKRAAEP